MFATFSGVTSMTKRIAIIQGHPDASSRHFGHTLAQAYAAAAQAQGHEVRIIEVALLDFPLLRNQRDFELGTPPEPIRSAQETMQWAEHLIIFFPLWLGTMPALLKAFFEQALRPGFAFSYNEGRNPTKHLAGKSARIVVTMGMPALIYRWYFGAHGIKVLKRSILGFCGIGPIKDTLIGMIGASEDTARKKWLLRMGALGRKGN